MMLDARPCVELTAGIMLCVYATPCPVLRQCMVRPGETPLLLAASCGRSEVRNVLRLYRPRRVLWHVRYSAGTELGAVRD
eukprot:2483010-Rhodomonas_salina.1